jgi:hypothetical protein
MSRGGIMAWLVELDVVSPPDEMEETEAVTLRFSDVPIRPFPPDDPDRPNLAWDNRLLEVPTIALDVYADATRLTGSLGTARLVLSNSGGALNAYRGWAFRAVRVWWGDAVQAAGPRRFANFRPMLDGRAETPRWAASATQASRLEVPVYDRRRDLEADIQPVTFAGDNVGDAGYEGGPEDLKDRPKPLSLGDLSTANIPIIWVNPASQTAQVHDGEIQGWPAIYDRGDDAGLVDDGDLSGGAFDAAAPDVGHTVTDLGRGLLRANQSFGGVVTAGILGAVDLVPGAGYLDTAPALIEALISRADPSAVIGASFATLTSNTKCSSLGGPVGNHPQRVNGSGIAQIFLPAGYGIGINFTGGSPVGHLAYVPGPNTLGHIDFSTLTVSRGSSLTAGSGGALIAAIIADSFTISLKIRNAADTEIYDLNDAMTGTIADIRLATGVPVPFILPAGWDILASGGGEHAIWYRQL